MTSPDEIRRREGMEELVTSERQRIRAIGPQKLSIEVDWLAGVVRRRESITVFGVEYAPMPASSRRGRHER